MRRQHHQWQLCQGGQRRRAPSGVRQSGTLAAPQQCPLGEPEKRPTARVQRWDREPLRLPHIRAPVNARSCEPRRRGPASVTVAAPPPEVSSHLTGRKLAAERRGVRADLSDSKGQGPRRRPPNPNRNLDQTSVHSPGAQRREHTQSPRLRQPLWLTTLPTPCEPELRG